MNFRDSVFYLLRKFCKEKSIKIKKVTIFIY